MGVANTKALAISNADQLYPKVLSASYLGKCAVYTAVGKVLVDAADSTGSVYRFARIPSGARIQRIDIFSEALSGLTAADVGVYNPQNEVGGDGAVVNDNLFADSVDLSVAQSEPYDVIFNNLGISNMEKRVWELLGLLKDPNVQYDLCITADTISSSAGYLAVRVEFVV